MKLLRYGNRGFERPGLLDAGGRIRDLSAVVDDLSPKTLRTRLSVLKAVDVELLPVVEPGVRLAEPVAKVGKMICVGLNYADHARETGQEPPKEPVLFLKATSSIGGPCDDIVLPPGSSKVDWEVELGVVIGREARYVSVQSALDHVAGLCVVNDVSERSFQLERGGQWDKGKGCDSFGPIGPYLVTLDEVESLGELGLWCEVNGRRVQNGNTRTMIFDVPFLVHYISHFMSLQPGDIISTGTPPGVGMGMRPPQWLKDGDTVELGIDGLGRQRQKVRAYLPSEESSR